jgi:hypothetical protein
MPYKSKAQEAYFNANRAKLENQGVDVDEWNKASQGKSLPQKVIPRHTTSMHAHAHMRKGK